MEPYYYSKMNKIQQNVYQMMKSGMTSLAASFLVPRVDARELQEIFFQMRLDCPDIFYAVSYKYRFYQDSTNIEVVPEYLFEKKKIKEHQKAMDTRIAKLIRPAVSMTEWEKEVYIHDFICTNVRYDKLQKQYSHEIIGPLGNGVGVCEGIAKTVKILCDALGIWCMVAVSEANLEKKIKYRHAWNVIRIGGIYYQLDVTFDNSISHQGLIRYDYFNLDDKRFFRDHEPSIYKLPVCSDDSHSYYREKKLSFTKMEDVEKRAIQAVRKGKTLVFHWRGGYLTREVLIELLELMEQVAVKKGKHVRASVNWAQGVLYAMFAEEEAVEKVVLEEANEGERL